MTLFFYCQHSVGMGHLVRSLTLAGHLAETCDVVFLNGGQVPAGLPFPEALERVDLPPLGMREDGTLVSLTASLSVDEALRARRDRIVALLGARRPDVLLVELFPFGRKKFEPELVPLLDAAHAFGATRPLVVCSLRDLLVTARRDQQGFDDRAQGLCDGYFDLVLVHTDPAFARLEESFRPSVELRTPVEYTGFMTRARRGGAVSPRRGLLVSAGGGQVGATLFRVAVAAHDLNWPALGLATTIVTGPFAPPDVVAELQAAAAEREGLEVLSHVPDLSLLLAASRASVSQCGYNTALELLASEVPALVVPFAAGRENEQTRRAERLAARGLLEVLPPQALTAARLAAAIRQLLDFTPPGTPLQMDGAAVTREVLSTYVAARARIARPVTTLGGAS